MSAPYPERKWREPTVADLGIHHHEVPYYPETPQEAANYMATILLPEEVSCYDMAHRQKVALDIANELFIAGVDIHDLLEQWRSDQAGEVSFAAGKLATLSELAL